ncbi:histidine phosphatase family protein [Roseobacter sinensis]|uniref:Histidine phosphatase family protein n=1 Tax=Roseobacter sinensis TaxID=2931391 RepID=A0ABT3BB54_9RHOB|nr:histidine phosphatase family protein [Roseobacter sp. WL0113]MCV3270810.1 histidine phosphatase family protein [Roseobacter sp. WL0113]
MIRLALLRHGHTAWNRAGRIQGRTDVPLDAEAEAQLAAMHLPAPWDRAALWSSPLARARCTAERVANRRPRTDPALLEMNWGDWEGQHGATLRADPTSGFRDIEHWGWAFGPPGGESPSDLRARLVPWAEGLTSDAVAVCHIGVMRVLLAVATGWDFRGPVPFQIKRNRLYIIAITPEGWQVDGPPIRLEARGT